ncbi:MAG: sulfotransferase domain-containing protein [Pirellulaceae bacterium]|nr:sulfotransferase domain-containing protein [Pirellulaceae bacterium]
MNDLNDFAGATSDRPTAIDKRFFAFRGFMKSGTNWVCKLLNLHPQISCIGELHLQSIYETVQADMRRLSIMENRLLQQHDHGTPLEHGSQVRQVVRANLQAMLRKTLTDLADPQATVIGERTPHTLQPLIIKDAPQITLIRDARDVLISRFFHLYNHPEVSRVFQRFPILQPRLKAFQVNRWYFRENPEQLLATEEMVRESMRWWREHLESDRRTQMTHPGLRVLTLKYEDVHARVNLCCRQMYEFLDVDPELAEPIPDFLQPGLKQERPGEFNRKGQVGDWRNYVFDDAKRWIKEEVGEELIRQGYEATVDW